MAPGAELFSVKVFPGGKLSDLIQGIQWAIDNEMHVINLSLTIAEPSLCLSGIVAGALQRGIVIVAAAGNDGGPIRYPAAIDGVLAVTALGNTLTFPKDSAHALRASELANSETGFFYANFSSLGPQVAFCAPGVAVISTVPNGYAAWDGTSMACPFITGLAALALSAYPEIRTGDLQQVWSVRHLLEAASQNLQLPPDLQGAGLPNATALLGAAALQQAAVQRMNASREEHLKALASLDGEFSETRKQIEELLSSIV
jgi:subtilisin family serine protease